MKIIDSEEFYRSWNDINVKNILFKVSTQFEGLTKAEFRICAMEGLWRTLRVHNPSKSKFTTFLWNNVKWACLDELTKQKRQHRKKLLVREAARHKVFSPSYSEEDLDHFRERMSQLPQENQRIIRMRYLEGCSLTKISKTLGYNMRRTRERVRQSFALLKTNVLRGVTDEY